MATGSPGPLLASLFCRGTVWITIITIIITIITSCSSTPAINIITIIISWFLQNLDLWFLLKTEITFLFLLCAPQMQFGHLLG